MSFRNRHKVHNFAETSGASETRGELAPPMQNAAEIGCIQQICKLWISLFPTSTFSSDGQLPINFNSVESLAGIESRAAFTVNSASVFREDVDIVPTIVDDTLSYVPWGGFSTH